MRSRAAAGYAGLDKDVWSLPLRAEMKRGHAGEKLIKVRWIRMATVGALSMGDGAEHRQQRQAGHPFESQKQQVQRDLADLLSHVMLAYAKEL